MPRLPALCASCGALYASPLTAKEPGKDNAFEVPVSCPACGEGGRVPAEMLTKVARVVAFCLEWEVAEEAWEGFRALLEEGVDLEGDDEEVRLDLARALHDRAPEFAELVAALPAGGGRELAAFAPLVGAAREVAAGVEEAGAEGTGEGKAPDAAELTARAVELALERHGVEREAPEVDEDVLEARSRQEAAGRNDPCPCGSGRKYKDCHWLEDLRTTRG